MWLILLIGGILIYAVMTSWGEAILTTSSWLTIWLPVLVLLLAVIWLGRNVQKPRTVLEWVFFLVHWLAMKTYNGLLSFLSLFVKEKPARPYINIQPVKEEVRMEDGKLIQQGRRLNRRDQDFTQQKEQIKEVKEILAKPPGKFMKELKATPEGNPLIESLKARKGQWKARIYIAKLRALREVAKTETKLYQALTEHQREMKEWAKVVARGGGPDGRLKLWLDSEGTPNLRKVIEEELEIERLARQREKAEIERDIAKFEKETREFKAEVTDGERAREEWMAQQVDRLDRPYELEQRLRGRAEVQKADIDKQVKEGKLTREEGENLKQRIEDRLAQQLRQVRLGLKEDEEVEEV